MSDKILAFDIETCPAPAAELAAIEPEFRPSGTLKDPYKIAADIERRRALWYEQAALSPVTGRVLMIGSHLDGRTMTYDQDTVIDSASGETVLIQEVFRWVTDSGMGANYKIAGFASSTFDWPFLVKRAWILGISLPSGLFQMRGKYAEWPRWLIDLRTCWTMGDQYEPGTQGEVARLLGVGDDYRINGRAVGGGEVAGLWSDLATRPHALAKLRNDLTLTHKIAQRLGFSL